MFLRSHVLKKLGDHEIPTSPVERVLNDKIEYSLLEKWRLSGFSTDPFFLENVVTLSKTSRSGHN